MKTILNKKGMANSLILAMLIILSSYAISPAAEKPARVAVIPFTVHAERDLSFLKQGIVDMLSSRLVWEGKVEVVSREELLRAYPAETGPLAENDARKIAAALGADYVLFGSMTVFGGSASIDAKLADMSGSRPTLAFFSQSQGMDEVIPRINQFAEEINAKVFGRKISGQALPPAPAPAQQPSIYAHPERLLEPELREGDFVKEGPSPFVVEREAREGSGFWKSPNIAEELKGIALADVTGDGKIETILMSGRKVLIYRAEAGRFFRLGEFTGRSYEDFIGVDAADIKKDGRAEIFVTALNTSSQRLESFVLEWQDNTPVPTATGLNWYFRVLNHPLRGPLLLGQRRGVTDLFVSGVHELEWSGDGYDAAVSLKLPAGITVYGLALGDIANDGREMIITFDRTDRLRLLDPSGTREWVSREPFGGSENFLDAPVTVSSRDPELNRVFLPQRILVVDLNRDGRNEVVVVKSEATGGRAFDSFRRFNEGRFESLSWDGLGLARNWHTREISGHVSDYAVGDFDNDGRPDLVAVVVSRRDAVIGKPRSSVIAYDLSPMAK